MAIKNIHILTRYIVFSLIFFMVQYTHSFSLFHKIRYPVSKSNDFTPYNNRDYKTVLKLQSTTAPSEIGDVIEIFLELQMFLSQNSNYSIISSKEGAQCLTEGYEQITSGNDLIYEVLNDSGKGVSDLGLEDECLEKELAYLLFIYNVDLKHFKNTTENASVYRFLNQTTFFLGMCIWRNCTNVLKNFFNETINKPFYNYLREEEGITNISFVRGHDKENPIEKKTSVEYTYFLVVFLILTIYIVIKIIISIIGVFYYSAVSKTRKSLDRQLETSSEEEESIDSSSVQKSTPIFGNQNNNMLDNSFKIPESSAKAFDVMLYKVYKFLSFFSNLKRIITRKNKYYNEKGTELLSFVRVFLVFFVAYNHNLWALIKVPIRDITNINFYTTAWFSMVKYSIFASDCWIALDGLIMAYKLMSFLKKNLNESYSADLSLVTFLKFYFNCFPKIVVFLFIFFTLHVYVEYFGYIIGTGPMYDYFIQTINPRYCKDHPQLLFIPFQLEYMEYNNSVRPFSYCYRFVSIFVNEFYCFTFVMIVFYIAYKLKSGIFDWMILILIIGNTIASFLTCDSYIGDQYTITFFLGETCSSKYTHLFINTYFLGVFTGMIYFYYCDVISSNPLATSENYSPFRFCYSLMIVLDKSSITLKQVYFFITIVIQILLSMSFFIYLNLYASEDRITVPINGLINFMDLYEKKFFLLAFNFTIIIMLLYPKDTTFRHLLDSNAFSPLSRISFAFFCAVDTITYIFYSVFHFQLHLNYQNLFFMTLGIIPLVSFFCVITVILCELPCRILVKKINHYSQKPFNDAETSLYGSLVENKY